MRPAARAALAATIIVALAACDPLCGSSRPGGGGQHLIFTGPVAGTLTTATTQCRHYTATTQLNVLLTGTLAGQSVTFNIQVNSGYKGPGDYPVGSILDTGSNLRLQVGSYVGSSATGAGTLTINKDQKSGSLDADLTGGEHVKGTFSCSELRTE